MAHSYRLGLVTWRYQVRIPVEPDICHRGYESVYSLSLGTHQMTRVLCQERDDHMRKGLTITSCGNSRKPNIFNHKVGNRTPITYRIIMASHLQYLAFHRQVLQSFLICFISQLNHCHWVWNECLIKQTWVIFIHFKLRVALARHNFKWVKI